MDDDGWDLVIDPVILDWESIMIIVWHNWEGWVGHGPYHATHQEMVNKEHLR